MTNVTGNPHAEVVLGTLPDDTLILVADALRVRAMDAVGEIVGIDSDDAADALRAMAYDPEDPGLFRPDCTGAFVTTLRYGATSDDPIERRVALHHDGDTCPIHELVPQNAAYREAIVAARELLCEQIRDPEGEANPEYTRGVVNLIAELHGIPGLDTSTRMTQVARDIGVKL
jgi:hypothetical protein